MSGSVEIKFCIHLFTRLLKSVGFSDISAEYVRLAKFNDPRAVHSLLRLTFELVYFSKYGCVDRLCAEGFEKFSDIEICHFIGNFLLTLDFPLTCLDISQLLTSRRLLLASIWILISCSIVSQIERALISSVGVFSEEQKYNSPVPGVDKAVGNSMSISRLIWLAGRLRIQMKHLFHVKDEVMNSFLTLAEKPSVISPADGWVSRDLSTLHAYIKSVQECISKVRIILSWKEVSHTFWDWIHSVMVIDEKSIGNELASDSLSASVCKFTELVTKLHDSIDHFVTKYPVFDDMKSSLLDNSANGSDVPIEDAFLGIHKDIRYLTDHLACANFSAETPIQLHQFRYNFVHEEQEDSKTKDKYVCNFDLKDECRKLKSVIENLKEQSEVIRHALSQKLQNVGADFLPEAIFLYNDV